MFYEYAPQVVAVVVAFVGGVYVGDRFLPVTSLVAKFREMKARAVKAVDAVKSV